MTEEKKKVRIGFWIVLAAAIVTFIAYLYYDSTRESNSRKEEIKDIKKSQKKRENDFFSMLKKKNDEIANLRKKTPSIKELKDENANLRKKLKKLKSQAEPTTLKVCMTQKKQLLFALEDCVEKHSKAVKGNELRETIIAAKNFQLAGWSMFYTAQEIDHARIEAIWEIMLKKEKKKKIIWTIVAFVIGFVVKGVI